MTTDALLGLPKGLRTQTGEHQCRQHATLAAQPSLAARRSAGNRSRLAATETTGSAVQGLHDAAQEALRPAQENVA